MYRLYPNKLSNSQKTRLRFKETKHSRCVGDTEQYTSRTPPLSKSNVAGSNDALQPLAVGLPRLIFLRRYLGREGHVRTRSRSSRWGPRVAQANKSQGRCLSAWPTSRTCPTRAPAVALPFPLVQEASPETVNTPPPFATGRDAWRSPARV